MKMKLVIFNRIILMIFHNRLKIKSIHKIKLKEMILILQKNYFKKINMLIKKKFPLKIILIKI